jgi:hypothetical protein
LEFVGCLGGIGEALPNRLMKKENFLHKSGWLPRGLRQTALSISFLSPIVRAPVAFLVMKIASLIFLPERRFLAFTSFQSRTRPATRTVRRRLAARKTKTLKCRRRHGGEGDANPALVAASRPATIARCSIVRFIFGSRDAARSDSVVR